MQEQKKRHAFRRDGLEYSIGEDDVGTVVLNLESGRWPASFKSPNDFVRQEWTSSWPPGSGSNSDLYARSVVQFAPKEARDLVDRFLRQT